MQNYFGYIVVLAYTLLVDSFLLNNVPQDQQCGGLPLICPQWCMKTDAKGCTVCSNNCHSAAGGGAVLSQQFGSLSIINPNSMLSYNPATSGQNGLSGISGQSGMSGNAQMNLGGNGGFNPANMGPQNPFLNGATVNHPGNPAGVANPSNTALATNTGLGTNPSNPGGLANSAGKLTGNQNQINPPGSQAGVAGNSSMIAIITSKPTSHTNKPTSGTNKPTSGTNKPITTTATTKVPATTPTPPLLQSTCSPVRCVPPCDKGISLDAAGCPVCLCI